MAFLKWLVEHPVTERLVITLILINAVTLGLETSPTVMAGYGTVLNRLDDALLAIFVLELTIRMIVKRRDFFRDPWSIFDLLVIGIALVPATESFSVLRALRVLRILRLITALPSLKRVVGGLISAMPGMGSISLLMALIYYVFAVMGTKLFGQSTPEQFGSLGATAYTLFQIMTFDDWSSGVAKPLMEKHSFAIVYIVVFILLSAFMMLNLFIGVVVTALDDEKAANSPKLLHDPQETQQILSELKAIRAELAKSRASG